MGNLGGKIALVTGGASGIGAETAALLASRGAAVVVADLNAVGANAVAAAIARAGGAAVAAAMDVTDERQVAAAVHLARSEFGGLDVVHNNAALLTPDVIAGDQLLTDADLGLWERVLRVNLLGYVAVAKHALPLLVDRGGGVVVNTASCTGVQAELGRPAYGTSKAAVLGLSRNIATQYGRWGVRSVALSVGVTATPALKANLSPEVQQAFIRHQLLPRLIEPRDVAEAVAFLASDAARMITGTVLTIDGGFSTHTPTFADELTPLVAARP